MQGDSIKALRIVSIAKGWDPQKIQGTGEDISNFNKYPSPIETGNKLGQLPEGIGINYPEDEEPPKYLENVSWNAPNRSNGSDASRRTTGADSNNGGM
jgi:hypothetical protein